MNFTKSMDIWTDFVLWETEEDANNATTSEIKNEYTLGIFIYRFNIFIDE